MSMIATGRGVKQQAKAGLRHAATAESQRNRLNDQIENAEDAEKKSTVGTLAGAGIEYGLSQVAAGEAATTMAAAGAVPPGAVAAGATTATTAGTAAGVGGTGVAAGGTAAAGSTAAATASAAMPWVGIALLAAGLFS